ncbi:MAG: PHP domain-containing protein, partial [Oscillospiraceae bacterium]|nr:PHP domain-containing protein [Oscillospiraceae bacterium]
MKYTVDNDLHIHSRLSLCSHDDNQTPEAILAYAKKYGLKNICLTDHFWDTDIEGYTQWYGKQNYEHICEAKPLPQADGIRFLFGFETELDRHLTLAITKEKMELMDFIVIPTTHFHMTSFAVTGEQVATTEARVKTWIERFAHVLSLDLPFKKVGLAHLTCRLITREFNDYVDTLKALPE